MTTPCRVLLVSGSLRTGSTNSAAIRAAAEIAPAGVTPTIFSGVAALPHFNPDDDTDPLPAPVVALRSAIAEADAVVISTPEYAGTLPGAFKNLLDWTVGGNQIQGRPVAWINVSTSGTAAAGAHATLRTVLGFVDAAIIEDACAHVPVPRAAVGPWGRMAPSPIRYCGRLSATCWQPLRRTCPSAPPDGENGCTSRPPAVSSIKPGSGSADDRIRGVRPYVARSRLEPRHP